MPRRHPICLGLMVAVLVVTQARGVDFEVSNGGTDTAACGVGPFTMPPSKCKTIGFAVGTRATGAPDRVLVMDGTYDTAAGEAFPIELKNDVSIIGNNAMPQNVVVNSGGTGNVFHADGPLSSSTIISGMTITPGTTASIFTGIRIDGLNGSEAVSAVIEHNRFVGGRSGINAGSNGDSVNLSPTVRHNTFADQSGDAIVFSASDSGTGQVLSPTISDNTITNPGSNGIHVSCSSSVEGNIAPVISGNTITSPSTDGIQLELTSLSDNSNAHITFSPMITGNTITGAGDDGIQVGLTNLSDTNTNDVILFNPTISGNTITGNGTGDRGITVSITDFRRDIRSLSLSANVTIANNTVTGMGGPGIEISVTNFQNMSNGRAVIAALISGNTVTDNRGPGIIAQATSIESAIMEFRFNPTIRNNTVSGNMSSNSGIEVRYTDSSAGGEAMVSGNQVVNNSGTGVLIDIHNSGSPVAADVALRNNTISGNGGDAVKVFGGSSFVFNSTNSTTMRIDLPARGNYAVDLGGGFKGGDGKNVLFGNTSGTGGSCASGGFCDINNNGPEDVAALCNHFTSSDVTDPTGAEEDFLNDDDDDAARGEIVPISSCQAAPCATNADCDDSDANTCDLCNPVTHLCVYFAVGGGCNDFNNCTLDDQCSGGVCTGTPRPAGTLCRFSAGDCDLAETCDGTDAPCPADAFEPSSTVCRPAVNTCDLAENCTGSSATCPPDAVLPDGATCTAEGNVCSVGTCAAGRAFVGFTAATGGGFETHDILSWTFTSGTINFPDFSSTAGLNLVGSAAQAGSVLRLTPSANSQGGAAWFTMQQPLQGGFDTTFQFQITNPGGLDAADGLAFVIQNSPAGVTALGSFGGAIGYGSGGEGPGIPNSLAVEFDTFDNGEPDIPHVSVHTRGMLENDQSETFSIGRIPFGAMTDGNPHTVRITYTPGTMQIFLDGAVTADLTVSVDLASLGLALECANLAAGNAGVECRAVAGACDVPEQCDGLSDVCPPDAVQPASVVCRPAVNTCDLAENCDGTSATCPADLFAPTGTACPDANVCTTAERCDGAGMCVPTPICPQEDTFAPASCGDGFDSDNDGLIDCADPDCANQSPCSPPAPTLSLPATALLAALLCLVGLRSIVRLRRSQ